MTPKELRISLIRSAFAGLLTTRTDLENDARLDLIEKWAAENVKKPRPLDPNEVPTDAPANWKWVSFSKIVTLEKGENITGESLPYLEARYLRGRATKTVLNSGEVVTPGTKAMLVDGENSGEVFAIPERGYLGSTFKVLNINPNVEEAFVIWFLKLHQDDYRNNKKGAAIPHLNKEIFYSMPFPLPSSDEQKRIIDKIETLMPLVDEYERVWNRLDVLNKSISSELTRSLLKAAAEGKLPYSSVGNSQDNNYLQLVRDDSLAFEKTLGKKASPILPIEESEIPFDIPDNWSWMRLSQLVSKRIKRGKSPKYIKSSGVLVFAQKCNTKKGYIDLSLSQFLDESQLSKYDESEYMEDGDIVINSTGGGTLGRVGIYHTTDNPLKMPIVPDSHVTVVRVNPRVNNKFVYYVLKYYQPYLETLGEGSTNQTELNPMTIAELLIPLPPRAEQDSIVATLEAVLPLCRDLETNPSA